MTAFILFLSSSIFAGRRLLTFLHIFQQEEYDSKRFIPWLIENRAFDKKMSAVILGTIIFSLFLNLTFLIWVISIGFLAISYFEKNPLTDAKKKLVLTDRAKRIAAIAFAIVMVIHLVLVLAKPTALFFWLIYIQLIPLSLPLATYILKPLDKRVNEKFRQEAVDKLKEHNPYIIAVTGSFGKTSIKHILGHILNNHAPTLITPGSVNTEMGITRIIREKLTNKHKYFIVEMGAYGIGSIARLCRLTPPKLSLISAIGKAHLERFKDLEGTAQAKFEIAEAAIKNNGQVIINTNVLEREYAKEYTAKHGEAFTYCGEGGSIHANNIQQSQEGLSFDLSIDNKTYPVLAPIYGHHHVDNMLLAIAAALQIGMNIEDIILSLKTVPQIKHRLEVKHLPNYTIIDDAFNSNPAGFMAALDVLNAITPKNGRRILVTPGMVELGEDHDKEHLKLGKKAAQTADIIIAVKSERIESFIKGINEESGNDKDKILKMASFKHAEQWIIQNAKKEDVILLENDLPDLYEHKISI